MLSPTSSNSLMFFFFFNDTATTEIYTLSLHDALPIDATAYQQLRRDGLAELHLMVDGLHCGACVWLIETMLARRPGVVEARVSLTTRRLRLVWSPQQATAEALVGAVAALGYRVVPFDPAALASDTARRERALLRALAVAG